MRFFDFLNFKNTIALLWSIFSLLFVITGCYKEVDDIIIDDDVKYKLTLKAIPENVGELSGAGEYKKGQLANVNADPIYGYRFLYWTIGGSVESSDASYDFVMPGKDITLTAHFSTKDSGPDGPGAGVNDIEGNFYPTRIMGGREWMVTNLRTTLYNNGEQIHYVPDTVQWMISENPGFCWYANDFENNNQKYGVLYNWYAVETGKLCPENWEIPTDEDWKVLEGVADSQYWVQSFEWDKTGRRGYDAGSQLAFNGQLWETGPLTLYFGFNMNSDFSALPGGRRNEEGIFVELHQNTYFWTRTLDSENLPWYREISMDYINIYRGVTNKNQGFSVRCIKSIK